MHLTETGQARRVRRIEWRPQRGYVVTGEKSDLARGTDELGRACQMPRCGDTEDNQGQQRPSIVVVGSGVREEWGWMLDHRARISSRHGRKVIE